jgi:hypothetical protein
MKEHLVGQKSKVDDKLKRSVLHWLCSHPTSFYAVGISALAMVMAKMC